jgi:hypothetical protein
MLGCPTGKKALMSSPSGPSLLARSPVTDGDRANAERAERTSTLDRELPFEAGVWWEGSSRPAEFRQGCNPAAAAIIEEEVHPKTGPSKGLD